MRTSRAHTARPRAARQAAQRARQLGCLVVLKPSPLIPGKTLSTACALLAYVDILFLNEVEATTMVKNLAPELFEGLTSDRVCVTVGDADLVAKALLDLYPVLHTVVINSLALVGLRPSGDWLLSFTAHNNFKQNGNIG